MTPIPRPLVRAVIKRDEITQISSLFCAHIPTVADRRADAVIAHLEGIA